MRHHLVEKGSEWSFNMERAPLWGGTFERMIQSTKQCLRKMIGQATLTYDELVTAVTEIESVINSRPLSYLSAGDMEEPLTPSHLLIGRRVLNLPDYLGYWCDSGDEDFEINPAQLTRRLKHLSNTLNHFWKRWRSKYLAELRESHRHLLKKTHGNPQVSVGDVVIIHDENLPRSFWKLGRIQDLIIGKDGQTRGATVSIAGKNRRFTSLNRPLQLLYPLEINHPPNLENASEETEGGGMSTKFETQPSDQPRPQHEAAQRGERERRMWIDELKD